MTQPVLIIANPVSGGGRGAAKAEQLAQAFEALGASAETRLTTLERNGRAIARELEPGAYEAIVAVGGDGSLHDVLAGLRDLATPVGLLPAGTANVWASESGIPSRPDEVASMVLGGRTVSAALADASGEPFFLFVGAGIDARIVRRVEEVRRRRDHRGGMTQWFWPAFREFVPRPLADLTVTVDGETLTGLAQVLITRVRSYAGMMSMPDGIDISDGALHVLAFERRWKPILLGTGVRAALLGLRAGRGLVHRVTQGPVRLESAAGEEPYHCDGDHHGQLPVEVTLTGREARLLVP